MKLAGSIASLKVTASDVDRAGERLVAELFELLHAGAHLVARLVVERVAAGAAEVEQVQVVLVDRATAQFDEGAVGLPEVGRRQLGPVAAHHADQPILVAAGVGHPQIVPAAADRGRQFDHAIRRGSLAVGRRVGGQGDVHHAAVGEIERVGQVVGVGQVVDQEVGLAVFVAAVGVDRLDQLVDLDALDQREPLVAQAVEVLEGGLVVDELPLQRRGHPPLGDGRFAGGDVAEVGRQRGGHVLAGHLGGDDLEIDQEPLLVLDDLGLRRNDPQFLGVAGAVVLNQHGQLERLGRLDLVGPGVVAENVALPEVVQVEFGLGVDGDGHGNERGRNFHAIFRVLNLAADEVLRNTLRGGLRRGNNQPMGRTGRMWSDNARPVHVGEPDILGRMNPEQVRHVMSGGVQNHHIHEHVLQGSVRTVFEFQPRVEGVAGHHDLLLELQSDPSADARRIALGHSEQAVARVLNGQIEIVEAFGAGLFDGLVRGAEFRGVDIQRNEIVAFAGRGLGPS